MGFNNVSTAMRLHSRVLRDKHNAWRVLLYMAQVSQDKDSDTQKAQVYFGGHESIARDALGRDFKNSDKQAVKRAIDSLIGLGIVERTVEACRGRNAEYRINLTVAPNGYHPAIPKPVDNSRLGITERYPIENGMGITQSPEWVSLSDQNGYHPVIPLQEDKIYKNTPNPLNAKIDGPVDNSEEGDIKFSQSTSEADQPETITATTEVSTGQELRRSPHPADDAETISALRILTADGTDESFARDMLTTALADTTTRNLLSRLQQAPYREELRSTVIGQRNRARTAALRTADPCPHGTIGGLLPTKANEPTCPVCRADYRRERKATA